MLYICAPETVDVAQLVRASDCGSEGRGFESHLPPKKLSVLQAVFLFKTDWGKFCFARIGIQFFYIFAINLKTKKNGFRIYRCKF